MVFTPCNCRSCIEWRRIQVTRVPHPTPNDTDPPIDIHWLTA